MGNIYFIHSFRYFRDEKEDKTPMRKPETECVRSEDFEQWLQNNGNRVLNSTFGIFFHEGNWLHQRPQLKRDLQELIKMIDGIKP